MLVLAITIGAPRSPGLPAFAQVGHAMMSVDPLSCFDGAGHEDPSVG
jgi:hypothetical protein